MNWYRSYLVKVAGVHSTPGSTKTDSDTDTSTFESGKDRWPATMRDKSTNDVDIEKRRRMLNEVNHGMTRQEFVLEVARIVEERTGKDRFLTINQYMATIFRDKLLKFWRDGDTEGAAKFLLEVSPGRPSTTWERNESGETKTRFAQELSSKTGYSVSTILVFISKNREMARYWMLGDLFGAAKFIASLKTKAF